MKARRKGIMTYLYESEKTSCASQNKLISYTSVRTRGVFLVTGGLS